MYQAPRGGGPPADPRGGGVPVCNRHQGEGETQEWGTVMSHPFHGGGPKGWGDHDESPFQGGEGGP